MVFKLKVFFFAALLSASPLGACADIITLFTPKMNWSVSNGVELEMGADGTLRSACMDVSAACDMTELVFKSGLRVRPDAVDFSAQAVWWPTLLRYFNVGVGSILHTSLCSDFFEADLLVGMYARYDSKKWFRVSGSGSFFFKSARIFSLADYVPAICNKSAAVDLNLDFPVAPAFHFWFDFSSYSFYNYMLFIAPVFKLGAEYCFRGFASVGTELEAQYIDMFTLSANFHRLGVRTFVTVEL